MRRYRRKLKLLAMALCALSLSGCQWLWRDSPNRSSQASSSLVDFLYQDGEVPTTDAAVELQLPIRVGVSFLPAPVGGNDAPTAVDRDKVLNAIREKFRGLPYVADIVIVPNYYFQTGRGDGLTQIEQLSRLYQLDLFALVSYDQMVDSTNNRNSLAYLTIVGAYFVRGDRHETHTLLDLAVIDPATRSLVLRAGGTSSLAGNTTAVDAQRHENAQRARGFELATANLVDNFQRELTDFETRVRAGTAPVKVAHRAPKSGGGGALDPLLLALLGAAILLAVRKRGMSPIALVVTDSRAWRGRRSSANARS